MAYRLCELELFKVVSKCMLYISADKGTHETFNAWRGL